MKSGITTFYEATFSHDSLFCKVDILHNGGKGWELFEVKSSTGLKDHSLDDIAMQCHVAIGEGVPIVKACLVHIDNSYVRQGEIEVEKLFAIIDVTETVMAMQQKVPENIDAMRDMLRFDIPETDIGPHCSTPYDCAFYGHCWQHIPVDSVFAFRDLGSPDSFDLYRKGILKMEDVPRETLG